MNWLEANLIEPELAESAIGKLRVPHWREAGTRVLLGFRPECLSFSEGWDNGTNILRARLQSSTFLGDQFIFTAMINDRPLLGKSRVAPLAKDGVLVLRVEPENIMLFPAQHELPSMG
jgi:hypothetical protein